MDGLLNIDKKNGITSFGVVAKVRKLTGERRVGHTGTLDRAATGVLVVLVGRATKLARFFAEDEKEYIGTVRLGESTDTDDSTGRVTARGNLSGITEKTIREVLRSFEGEIEQIPPAYSRVRVRGIRLHELARKGLPIDVGPRRVEIRELEVLKLGSSEIKIRVVCSKGTYMRALARDIGGRLGCGAHLRDLVRTRAGDNLLEKSIDIDRVCRIEEHIVSMKDALGKYPMVTLTSPQILCLRRGQKIALSDDHVVPSGQMVRLCGTDGDLLGVGMLRSGLLTPMRILA